MISYTLFGFFKKVFKLQLQTYMNSEISSIEVANNAAYNKARAAEYMQWINRPVIIIPNVEGELIIGIVVDIEFQSSSNFWFVIKNYLDKDLPLVHWNGSPVPYNRDMMALIKKLTPRERVQFQYPSYRYNNWLSVHEVRTDPDFEIILMNNGFMKACQELEARAKSTKGVTP